MLQNFLQRQSPSSPFPKLLMKQYLTWGRHQPPPPMKSRRTIVWSFHRPGPPVIVCSICRRWLHARLNIHVVWLLFAPRWLFFNQYSHLSVVICVQLVDPTHPGNPAILYSCMLDRASGKCKGVITNLEYREVLPKSMKA